MREDRWYQPITVIVVIIVIQACHLFANNKVTRIVPATHCALPKKVSEDWYGLVKQFHQKCVRRLATKKSLQSSLKAPNPLKPNGTQSDPSTQVFQAWQISWKCRQIIYRLF
jgi:hypothetical protein